MQMRNKTHFPDQEVKTGGIDEACTRYCLGKATMRKVAESANAVIRIGKRYLINFEKVDRYLNSISDDGRP